MNTTNHPDAMNVDAEAPTQPKKSEFREEIWGAVLAGPVLGGLVRWMTDWPWWIASAPGVAAIILILIYAYGWKRRRRDAGAGRAGTGHRQSPTQTP